MKRTYGQTPEGAGAAGKAERNRIELLQSRIHLLDGMDRLLMTMHLENGNSFRQIARLVGMNEASIARRIKKITKRLADGEYIKCLRSRNRFTKQELAIAKDYFLSDEPIRKIAEKRNCTYYHIHKNIERIKEVVAEVSK
ncbi:MAG: hypothetical protein V3W45_01690 [Sedimentisphaerales bacterium]